MEFCLRNGKKVEIIFWLAKNGKIKAFPENDLKLVKIEGTTQAKTYLATLLRGFRSWQRIPKQHYYESF